MKTKSSKRIGLISLFAIALLLTAFYVSPTQKNENSAPKIEIQQVDAQKAIVIKADIPMSEISTKMGEIYQQLFTYLDKKSIAPAGPPFAVYYSYEPEGNVVFEGGIPVQEKVDNDGDITYMEYPEMKVVSTLYVGVYEQMEGIYMELDQYLKDNKLESTGTTWEVYLTDPNEVASPEENQTLIYFPIQ